MKKIISLLLSIMLAISTIITTAVYNTAYAAQDATLLYGDVNMDGLITISDVVVLNRFIVRGEELSQMALTNANVCIDDVVDSEDSLLILKFLVKLETQIPIEYEVPKTTTEVTTITTEATTTTEAITTSTAVSTTVETTTTTTEVAIATETATEATTTDFVALEKEVQIDDDATVYNENYKCIHLDMSKLSSDYDLYSILCDTELVFYYPLRGDKSITLKVWGTLTYYDVSFVDCERHEDTCNDTLICTYATDDGNIRIYRCISEDCYHIEFFKS